MSNKRGKQETKAEPETKKQKASARRALFVGINYFDSKKFSELSSCIDDVLAWKGVLGPMDESIVLRDFRGKKNFDYPSAPTRANILSAMDKLAKATKAGDTLYFIYSGHGSSVTDRNNDERVQDKEIQTEDDELICPVDGKNLIDDVIYSTFIQPVPTGAKIRIIFDCCYSGSGADLPFLYKFGDQKTPLKENSNKPNANVVFISGCTDKQESEAADKNTILDGVPLSALTWACIKHMRNSRRSRISFQENWKEFASAVRSLLLNLNKEQQPLLSVSHENVADEAVDIPW